MRLLNKVTKTRPAPLSRQYVFATCSKSEPDQITLLHKLQASRDAFKPVDIAAETMDHLAAGIDTTGDALCFLLYYLSLPQNTPIQAKLIFHLVHNKDKPIEELEYLDAVIKEGLRLWPPIPMSQPRYVPQGGRIIDGFGVSGGTVVSAQAWSVHRLNERVFESGEEFRPERWLEGDKERKMEMMRGFFTFGMGGRGCTGR